MKKSMWAWICFCFCFIVIFTGVMAVSFYMHDVVWGFWFAVMNIFATMALLVAFLGGKGTMVEFKELPEGKELECYGSVAIEAPDDVISIIRLKGKPKTFWTVKNFPTALLGNKKHFVIKEGEIYKN